ncbi:hypothetical protein EDC56_0236 [Sinobacterium caligoides]|uniref:Uncharacterized protein n=1 Tax=Sinobacterium caligoides TaxID=933926 RepID=A0A3N2DY13_9GAMM|nr:hypothetical protein EDC56_0236 [Sinobacterium caligoides]
MKATNQCEAWWMKRAIVNNNSINTLWALELLGVNIMFCRGGL